MATPDFYIIDDEKLQLGEVVKRCESIARKNKHAFFVGREAIRGRLRCGIRTWVGLTSRISSTRSKDHPWRQPVGAKGVKRGHAPKQSAGTLDPAAKPAPAGRRITADALYEPEDYVGPDESLDALLKGY